MEMSSTSVCHINVKELAISPLLTDVRLSTVTVCFGVFLCLMQRGARFETVPSRVWCASSFRGRLCLHGSLFWATRRRFCLSRALKEIVISLGVTVLKLRFLKNRRVKRRLCIMSCSQDHRSDCCGGSSLDSVKAECDPEGQAVAWGSNPCSPLSQTTDYIFST